MGSILKACKWQDTEVEIDFAHHIVKVHEQKIGYFGNTKYEDQFDLKKIIKDTQTILHSRQFAKAITNGDSNRSESKDITDDID